MSRGIRFVTCLGLALVGGFASAPASAYLSYHLYVGSLGSDGAQFTGVSADFIPSGTVFYDDRGLVLCHPFNDCQSLKFDQVGDLVIITLRQSDGDNSYRSFFPFPGAQLDRVGGWFSRSLGLDTFFIISGSPGPLPAPPPPPPNILPEPGTWALMIAGFGLVGSALRHRRKSMTVA